MEIKFHQYIILNKSLGMSLGKSCAMTAHSSYLALREQEKTAEGKKLINKWLKNGECVIVLEAYTSTQMFGLQQYLDRKGISNHLYIDECVGEGNMGEPNALSTGVLTEEESEWLTTINLYSDNSKMETTEELVIEMNKKVNKEIYGIEIDDYPRKQIYPIFDENSYLNYFNQSNCIFEWGKKPTLIKESYMGSVVNPNPVNCQTIAGFLP